MRIVSLLLMSCLVALSYAMYEVKYDTAEMEDQVAGLRLKVQKERDAIAILRAEWSHLNRPERVERLARKHLGMVPVRARQMITMEQLAAARRKAGDGPVASGGAGDLRHPVKAVR
jgi:cell division protein FtsL